MRKTYLLHLMLVVSSTASLIGAPLRIVCIGDSITQGRGKRSDSGAELLPTDGWRYAFWKKCVAASYTIEMVGSLDTGFESTPVYEDFNGEKFSNRHEARWGWSAEALRDQIKETHKLWIADLALIYLGTNRETPDNDDATDPDGVARTAAAMKSIVEILRANNPDMTIVLRSPGGNDARPKGLLEAYRKIATEFTTETAPVIGITQGVDWQWDPARTDTDTVDGCHPNKQGDSKIADDFFKASQGVLSGRRD